MRQACLLALTLILLLGGGTIASAGTAAECQAPALSKAIDDSATTPKPLFLSTTSQDCTMDNFHHCLIGSPEDPEYCPCNWVWCDNIGLACGYFY